MEINGNIFAPKHIKVSDKNHHKMKLKGIHNYKQIVTIPFPMSEKIIALKCAVYYKDRGDNATKLLHGEFSYSHKQQAIVLCMHEKINRPLFFIETIPREEIQITKIATLKRRTAPASATPYSNGFKKTKQKIAWGTSSPRCGDIERQLTIPSKYGLIHSEGSTFLLNNRVIAYVEQGNIVPTVDVTTPSGDYLYRRVMSIFQLDTIRDKGNEYTIKNGHIIKNNEQIGYWDSHGTRFNSKATEEDKKIIYRMQNYDDTLTKVSVKKREIQQALA